MTWGRIDDQAHEDERFWGLPMAALGLYYGSLSRCLHRDENFVSHLSAEKLTTMAGEAPDWKPLVERGLWLEVEGGWTYLPDDWRAFKRPETPVEKLWRTRSENGKKGAAARWHKNGKTDGKPMANRWQTDGKGMANDFCHMANDGKLNSKPDGKPMAKYAYIDPVPDPVPVPGISLATNVANSSVSQAKPDTPEPVENFVRVWNENCLPLPRLRRPPSSKPQRDAMVRAVEYFADDWGALARAVRRAAKDQHYRENRYGWETFCRHLARWDGEDIAPTDVGAERAQRWADQMRKLGYSDLQIQAMPTGLMPGGDQ